MPDSILTSFWQTVNIPKVNYGGKNFSITAFNDRYQMEDILDNNDEYNQTKYFNASFNKIGNTLFKTSNIIPTAVVPVVTPVIGLGKEEIIEESIAKD